MKIFVTFGHGQFGGVFRNVYLEFEGEASEAQADRMVREFMRDNFNSKWCGTYTEKEFAGQAEEYKLFRLVKFDLHGNIRERALPMEHCKFSTGVDGGITAGRGHLDAGGYWEFPCEPCATRANERMASRMEQEKPFGAT
jgi:hypothetical protein